jgi:predicted transcriptional regulator
MKLFSALKSIERHVKLRCLSCEGEIITFLLENGPSRPNRIVSCSRYSNIYVYNKLKDLIDNGIVEKIKIQESARYLYKVNDDILGQIENNHEAKSNGYNFGLTA